MNSSQILLPSAVSATKPPCLAETMVTRDVEDRKKDVDADAVEEIISSFGIVVRRKIRAPNINQVSLVKFVWLVRSNISNNFAASLTSLQYKVEVQI